MQKSNNRCVNSPFFIPDFVHTFRGSTQQYEINCLMSGKALVRASSMHLAVDFNDLPVRTKSE
jgi:hypothetical protein